MELVPYLDVMQIEYNRMPYQHYDQSKCEQLCLQAVNNQFKNWHCILSTQYSFKHVTDIKLTRKNSGLLLSGRRFEQWRLRAQFDSEIYHVISIINSLNNKFYFDEDDKEIVIPEGSYEICNINKYLYVILQF